MSEKTFYFMSGLPRSGSTLLTALLNQHPSIYASPQSNLLNMYWSLQTSIWESEPWKLGLRNDAYERTLNSLGNIFYADINKKLIIDKNRAWGTPGNEVMAKKLNKNPKTILVLRPILEVLSSFIKLAKENPNNFIDNDIAKEDFFVKYYKDVDSVRCDYLMRSNGEIDRSLLAIANLTQNPKNCHIIWYKELLENPQEILNETYKFLEIDIFKNNFHNIQSLEKHNDKTVFGIKNLHTVRSSITAATNNVSLLPISVQSKYKNYLDFIPR